MARGNLINKRPRDSEDNEDDYDPSGFEDDNTGTHDQVDLTEDSDKKSQTFRTSNSTKAFL